MILPPQKNMTTQAQIMSHVKTDQKHQQNIAHQAKITKTYKQIANTTNRPI